MNIAFLGLGAMGARMAANLLDAGHTLYVWNRTESRALMLMEREAVLCSSPLEAAAHANIVIAMSRDDDSSRHIWLDEHSGAVQGLQHGSIAIECSTLSLPWCLELADRVRDHGADFLDAPVVGSRPQAEGRQLIHLVGGDTMVLARARPALEASAGHILHAGKCGDGMTMKLAVNALFAIQVAALGELLGFIDACDIERRTAVQLLGDLPVTSPAARAAAGAMVSENYDPLFPISLVEKDLGYAVAGAESRHAQLPATAFVREQFRKAIGRGYDNENIHAVAKLFKSLYQPEHGSTS